MITSPLTGRAIKEFLMQVGEGSAYDFYKEFTTLFPKPKRPTSYNSVRRYFYILRRLGLIEFTRSVPSKAGFPKRLHRIVPGMEKDPRWDYPQIALFPTTGFGGKKGKFYEKWVREGKPPEELEKIKRKYGLT